MVPGKRVRECDYDDYDDDYFHVCSCRAIVLPAPAVDFASCFDAAMERWGIA